MDLVSGEELKHHATHEVCVAVGVTQLIGHGVEQEVPALLVQQTAERQQQLEARATAMSTVCLRGNGRCGNVEDESVDQRRIVTRA